MDALAEEAGVGKGTVFRRFESRAGLMAALVNDFEMDWQEAVLSGPPPLGPGAPPLDRLLAMGRSRMELNLTHARLMEAAGWELTQGRPRTRSSRCTRVPAGRTQASGAISGHGSALIAPLARRGDQAADRASKGWTSTASTPDGPTWSSVWSTGRDQFAGAR